MKDMVGIIRLPDLQSPCGHIKKEYNEDWQGSDSSIDLPCSQCMPPTEW